LGGVTCLHRASYGGHQDAVEYLLKHGADPKLKSTNGWTALVEAAYGGHLEILKYLQQHAKLSVLEKDNNGFDAIHHAASNGQDDIVDYLLSQGAKVSDASLQTAAAGGHISTVRKLLGLKVNVNHVEGEYQTTALQMAAYHGDASIVKLLLTAGAKVDVASKNGWTALHEAAEANAIEVIEMLLKAGADANIKDTEGRAARDIAESDEAKALLA